MSYTDMFAMDDMSADDIPQQSETAARLEAMDRLLQTPPLTRGNSAVSSFEDQVGSYDGDLSS